MTREEIRRHALAIAALRRSNRSKGQHRVVERGYNTPRDYTASKRYSMPVTVKDVAGEAETGAVDKVFEARLRSGYLPRERRS